MAQQQFDKVAKYYTVYYDDTELNTADIDGLSKYLYGTAYGIDESEVLAMLNGAKNSPTREFPFETQWGVNYKIVAEGNYNNPSYYVKKQ